MMTRTLAFALVLGLGIAACGDSTDPLTNDDFAPGLGVDLAAMTKTTSGLYYQDLQVGDGTEAVAGTAATVHYEGFLANGTKFDSSRDRDEPFTFGVGAGSVIAGFDEGVRGMQVGGMRKLVLPPELAYGEQGAGTVIPPNATLVFDVELLAVTE
jgi:FKBP-type peptidyl-prolyl cis-trans isomerase FkpA